MPELTLRRLDDYQSWQILFSGTCILIDPWLTPEPITGSFDRQHTAGFTTLADIHADGCEIAAVLLCTSVNDHARPKTLQLLANTSVYGPAKAAAVARKAGCASTHAITPGATFTFACRDGGDLRVTVTRTGLPLGIIAVGYIIEGINPDGSSAGRIWIEPHQPTPRVAKSIAPIDIAVLPCQSVTAVVMPVNAGTKVVARAARLARARTIVATATDPRRDMSRWQRLLYPVRGGAVDVRAALAGASTVVEMAPRAELHA